MDDLMNEKFTNNGKELGYSLIDFWKFLYSNIYDLQSEIAEFVVAKALGLNKACNTEYWTLFDIKYRGLRIEVKETSYYHPWNKNGKVSNTRVFGITMANSRYEANAEGEVPENFENKFERQNDIYVFCLNTGNTAEESYPLSLNNWEFYVVPTSVINDKCGNNKTVNLNRVRTLAQKTDYDNLKREIDLLADDIIKKRAQK